jgi:hypothetical protein
MLVRRWYDAKVIDVQVTGDAQEFAVHYVGCKASPDEWVSRDRLRASHPSPAVPVGPRRWPCRRRPVGG